MHGEPAALRHAPVRWLKPAGYAGAGLALLVLAGGLASRGVAGAALKAWTLDAAVPTVAVIHPSAESGSQGLTLPGSIEADNTAVIHARVSGYLKTWRVDIGAPVKAGQALADIDTPELDQQLAQAQANLATALANQKLARLTADRWSNLLKQDAVSQQEADEKSGDLEAKTALVQAARAEVDRLQALQGFKHIVAPFDGVVTARNTDIGALIAAGDPTAPGLFTVADVRRLRLYVRAPEAYAAEVRVGDEAAFTVPEYPGRTFKARLAATSDAIGAQSGALLIELMVDNRDGLLKPGGYAQVAFTLPRPAGGVQIPASAVMFRQNGTAVALAGPDGRAVIRPVSIATDLGPAVEIASGLSPADRLIDNPPDSLTDGEPVRIAAAGKAG
jgi:RND family efflux transporter MFP subunit